MGRLSLLVVVLAAGCGVESPPEPTAPSATPLRQGPSAIVFDTTEPPEVVVRIPEVPDGPPPAPPPRPRPESPRPTPPPPPAPPGGGPSGSCDVRETEGYCFTYTGAGWTPRSARANCAGAPAAAFGPGACPLDDRIATCAFRRPSEPDREILYTYYAPADLALAELACPGTFTPIRD